MLVGLVGTREQEWLFLSSVRPDLGLVMTARLCGAMEELIS